jgi:hypothetical protein
MDFNMWAIAPVAAPVRRRHAQIVLLLIWCFAIPASAQPPGEGPARAALPATRGAPVARGSRGLPIVAQQLVAQGDKDGDNELSKEELTGVVDAWFGKFDPDGTGSLSQDQLVSKLRDLFPAASASRTPPAEDSSGPGQRTPGAVPGVTAEVLGPILFAATDTDKDGSLTRAEFKQAFARWFDDWDTRKTGKLNEEDLRKGLEKVLPRSSIAARTRDTTARPRTEPSGAEPLKAVSREASATNPPMGNPERATPRNPEVSSASAARGDFALFSSIVEKNIFDTNRRGRRRNAGDDAPPKRVDTVTLVGTLTSEKGSYAFFDGSSPEFRKVLQTGGRIAGYQIAGISADWVDLEVGTNRVQLDVQMQLRREEEGDWIVAGGSDRAAASNSSSSAPKSETSSEDDSDIVKRLMQQREQELK